ncbi:hypothetical protein GW17_00048617 [Ensete ventricosum]|nr:hypothetical protein GW17_00048617 [Ensete ventricosum]
MFENRDTDRSDTITFEELNTGLRSTVPGDEPRNAMSHLVEHHPTVAGKGDAMFGSVVMVTPKAEKGIR